MAQRPRGSADGTLLLAPRTRSAQRYLNSNPSAPRYRGPTCARIRENGAFESPRQQITITAGEAERAVEERQPRTRRTCTIFWRRPIELPRCCFLKDATGAPHDSG